MKKATQKTIFKLLSLVLTLAMVFAVAIIPTLTASADEVTYVTNKMIDFEDGQMTDSSSAWAVADSSAAGGHGTYSLKKNAATSSNTDYYFKSIMLQAGHTYYISAYFRFIASGTRDAVNWVALTNYNTSGAYLGNYFSVNGSLGVWYQSAKTVTPDVDVYLGLTTDDEVYVDDLYVVDVTNIMDKGLYATSDGVIDCENEVALVPGSNTSVSYVDDDTYGKVASFNVSKTDASYSVNIPVNLKYNKTYKITFSYKLNLVGTNTTYWYRLCDSADTQITAMDKGKGVWTDVSYTYTCTNESGFTSINFDSTVALNVLLANFRIAEVKTNTNTAVKQDYDFDFSNITFTSNSNSALKIVERDNYKTQALVFNSLTSNADAYTTLDKTLTAGKYYKLSFDYKGVSNFRALLHSGGWSQEMYQSDPVATSTANGIMINSGDGWSHHENVFCAKYNSTGIIFIDAYTTDNAAFYIDNVTVEEYSPSHISVNYEEDSDYTYNHYDSYSNTASSWFSVVKEEKKENNVLKFGGAGSPKYYYFPSMPLQTGHTYYVSFDYYGGNAFARDIATTGAGVSTTGTWITPSETEWKKNVTTYTVTEEDNNGMFILLCNGSTVNYFDNFFIADITDSYSPAEGKEYVFDFEDESKVLIEANYNNVTDLAFEEDTDYGRVAKLTFASGSSGVVGKTYVPYTMKADTTYKVSITYKADDWVGISWADKDNAGNTGANGINFINNWATETRYVTGADDMPYFFVVSPEAETNITIANIKITPAGGLTDVNGDGALDATDVTLMRNRVLGARDDSKMFEKYADNNSDTVVDIRDLVTLNNRTK